MNSNCDEDTEPFPWMVSESPRALFGTGTTKASLNIPTTVFQPEKKLSGSRGSQQAAFPSRIRRYTAPCQPRTDSSPSVRVAQPRPWTSDLQSPPGSMSPFRGVSPSSYPAECSSPSRLATPLRSPSSRPAASPESPEMAPSDLSISSRRELSLIEELVSQRSSRLRTENAGRAGKEGAIASKSQEFQGGKHMLMELTEERQQSAEREIRWNAQIRELLDEQVRRQRDCDQEHERLSWDLSNTATQLDESVAFTKALRQELAETQMRKEAMRTWIAQNGLKQRRKTLLVSVVERWRLYRVLSQCERLRYHWRTASDQHLQTSQYANLRLGKCWVRIRESFWLLRICYAWRTLVRTNVARATDDRWRQAIGAARREERDARLRVADAWARELRFAFLIQVVAEWRRITRAGVSHSREERWIEHAEHQQVVQNNLCDRVVTRVQVERYMCLVFAAWHGAARACVTARHVASLASRTQKQLERTQDVSSWMDKLWAKQELQTCCRHILLHWKNTTTWQAKEKRMAEKERHTLVEISNLRLKNASRLTMSCRMAFGMAPEQWVLWCVQEWASLCREEKRKRESTMSKKWEGKFQGLLQCVGSLMSREQDLARIKDAIDAWKKMILEVRMEKERLRNEQEEAQKYELSLLRTMTIWVENHFGPTKVCQRFWDLWIQVVKDAHAERLQEENLAVKVNAAQEKLKLTSYALAKHWQSVNKDLVATCFHAWIETMNQDRRDQQLQKLRTQVLELQAQKFARIREAFEGSLSNQVMVLRNRVFSKWAVTAKEGLCERLNEKLQLVALQGKRIRENRKAKCVESLFRRQQEHKRALLREWQFIATALFYERQTKRFKSKQTSALAWSDKHIGSLMYQASLRVSFLCWKAWKAIAKQRQRQEESMTMFRHILRTPMTRNNDEHDTGISKTPCEESWQILAPCPSLDTLLAVCFWLWFQYVQDVTRRDMTAELQHRREWEGRMIREKDNILSRVGASLSAKISSSLLKSLLGDWYRIAHEERVQRDITTSQQNALDLQQRLNQSIIRLSTMWFCTHFGPTVWYQRCWNSWREMTKDVVLRRTKALFDKHQAQFMEWKFASVGMALKRSLNMQTGMVIADIFASWKNEVSDCTKNRMVESLKSQILELQAKRFENLRNAFLQGSEALTLELRKNAFVVWGKLTKEARANSREEDLRLRLVQLKNDFDDHLEKVCFTMYQSNRMARKQRLLLGEWQRVAQEEHTARTFTRLEAKRTSLMNAWNLKEELADKQLLVKTVWARWADLINAGKVDRSCEDMKFLLRRILQVPPVVT